MLLRFALTLLVIMLVGRAIWRVLSGIVEGASPSRGARRGGPPERGVQMVRDPVCGTFLPPSSAITLAERGGAVRYFCSEKCRNEYAARS
jgi:uncharacterized protein